MEQSGNPFFINAPEVGSVLPVTVTTHTGEPEEIPVHYLEGGAGEPLLLVHGIGQSLYTWRNVYAELSEHYRVIAVDLPGHGYSGRPEHFAYSMDEMATLLYEFLTLKGITCSHVIGFSTGAGYLMRMLSLYPDSVANFIALCPGGINKHMPKLYQQMKRGLSAVFVRNLFTAGDVQNILEDAVYREDSISEQDVDQYFRPLSDGLSREAMMYAVTNYDLKGTLAELKENDHEILCVWGREDTFHPTSGSLYFQNNLQNGRYYMIRETGHLVQEEAPDDLLRVISSYIPV